MPSSSSDSSVTSVASGMGAPTGRPDGDLRGRQRNQLPTRNGPPNLRRPEMGIFESGTEIRIKHQTTTPWFFLGRFVFRALWCFVGVFACASECCAYLDFAFHFPGFLAFCCYYLLTALYSLLFALCLLHMLSCICSLPCALKSLLSSPCASYSLIYALSCQKSCLLFSPVATLCFLVSAL